MYNIVVQNKLILKEILKMKKILLLALVVCLAFALIACQPANGNGNNENNENNQPACTEHADFNADGVCDTEGCDEAVQVNVMSYAEYAAAELSTFVVIDAYVQAHQSWWSNKITVYLADEDGAYFAYEMACSEEDAARLTPGTKIRVYGYKDAWAGEVEITDCGFYFLEGDTYVATPVDLTDKLGTDELINYQNQLAKFTDMTVTAIAYRNDAPGDDIYVTLEKNGEQYSFCVEVYLTGTSSDLYKLFTQGTVLVGDEVDIEAFLYWYDGVNPHIVSITNINE